MPPILTLILILAAVGLALGHILARFLPPRLAIWLCSAAALALSLADLVFIARHPSYPRGHHVGELLVWALVALLWMASIGAGWFTGRRDRPWSSDRRDALIAAGTLIAASFMVYAAFVLIGMMEAADRRRDRDREVAADLERREHEARDCARTVSAELGSRDARQDIRQGAAHLYAYVRNYQEATNVEVIGVYGIGALRNRHAFITEVPIRRGGLWQVEYVPSPKHVAGGDPWRGDAPSTHLCDTAVRAYVASYNKVMMASGHLRRVDFALAGRVPHSPLRPNRELPLPPAPRPVPWSDAAATARTPDSAAHPR
jgi:hypothetical protein